MRKILIALTLLAFIVPLSLSAHIHDGDDGPIKLIRIFLSSGDTEDFDAAVVDSITTTIEGKQTIWYEDTCMVMSISDIDSIWYISPILRLSSKNLTFGKVTVGYDNSQTVTLTNTGDYQETFMMLADDGFKVTGLNECKEQVIMPGQSLSIDLSFQPEEVKKYYTKLIIASGSAEYGLLTLPLSGEGVEYVNEEATVDLPPVEKEFDIVLSEDESPESFENFKIINIYGEFSAQAPSSAKGLRRIRRAGHNYNVYSSTVQVSSNGLQFHSLTDALGNPFMFSITLPNENPEFSVYGTALAIVMSSPYMITANETEYRNAERIVRNLDSFEALIKKVSDAYYYAKNHNMCPDYSDIDISPVIYELHEMTKNTQQLTLSGVSLKNVQTTPQSATFKIRNDWRRTIHAYPSRVKMNEGNTVIVGQEDASESLIGMLNKLIDKGLGELVEDDPLWNYDEPELVLDEEDLEFIKEVKKTVQDTEALLVSQYPGLGNIFQIRLPYILQSSNVDYIDALGDCFDALVYNIGRETSIFEEETGTIKVPFKDYDKIFVDIYGIGLANNKSWYEYTDLEKQRIILSLLWGAYYDFVEPFWKMLTGLNKIEKTWNSTYNFDFRYGARKYPEWAFVAKLLEAFVTDYQKNVVPLIDKIEKRDSKGIWGQLSKFCLDELKKIPNEKDEDKVTYTNLIYNIFKKWSGKAITSAAFKQTFKSSANQFLNSVNIIFTGMSVAENVVDLKGADYALKHGTFKETHVIDKYDKPYINITEPTICYQSANVTVHFEWEAFKGNRYGEWVYDLEMMTESRSNVAQTVVMRGIEGTSCDYTLSSLTGVNDAVKVDFRITARDKKTSLEQVTTNFIPLMIRNVVEGPEMVDLGLPSGTLWGQHNLGAKSNYEFGNYYAWGELSGFLDGKTSFSWKNYSLCKGTQTSLTKYCTKSSYGKVDNTTQLDIKDDIMRANYGYYYSIPTKDDWEELKKYCRWSRLGDLIMIDGPNGQAIFLPLGGYRSGLTVYDEGTDGYYWSSTLDHNSPDDAWFMHVKSGKYELNSYYRYQGRCIRPVMRKKVIAAPGGQ